MKHLDQQLSASPILSKMHNSAPEMSSFSRCAEPQDPLYHMNMRLSGPLRPPDVSCIISS